MNPVSIVVLALFIAAGVFYLFVDYYDKTFWRQVTKPLLMPLLLLFYLLTAAHPLPLLVAALVFGFLGDTLLLGSGRFFPAGLLAFLLGHVCYISLFILHTAWQSVPIWVFAAALLYIAYGFWLMRRLLPGLNEMKLPGFLYLGCILLMSLTALLRAAGEPRVQTALPFIGSLFFIVSDSLLSLDAFTGSKKIRGPIIMITYLTAQALITVGFLI